MDDGQRFSIGRAQVEIQLELSCGGEYEFFIDDCGHSDRSIDYL